jgi:tRNA-dihydrouridine synthase B
MKANFGYTCHIVTHQPNNIDTPISPPPLRIGGLTIDPPVLQAPMAGFTDWAFREIVRRCGGAGLLTTEMFSARGFLEMDARGRNSPARLWGVKREQRPLAVQIWDNDPATLAEVGARLVGDFDVSVVDINFGCPVKRVTEKAKSGSYLLRDPELVGRIVSGVVAACRPVPVTAKIRLGLTPDSINAPDVARSIESAGAAAITVHGRTTAEMFRGRADWDQIAQIKPHLRRMPLIGNGDLTTPQSVIEAFGRYGVDGVMIGRGALGRPWLFAQVEAAIRGQALPPDPSPTQQRGILLEHFDLIVDRWGPQHGTMLMRRYACCYAQGLRGARRFRSMVSKASTPAEFQSAVDGLFSDE